MGKLIRLELFNFKSYKGHHVLQFGDSYFTSIIGPNGSGKSNSMDAISFVLGIKSSHLRSTHLRDLVYRGRVLRTSKIGADGAATEQNGDDGTNGVTNGHVDGDEEDGTQTSSQRNDPQTAWVMAVYEDDAGEEQNEYRINNRVVGAKQYNEALEAENILIKARNFLVFQGDDLTRLIEQISGSAEAEKAGEEQAFKLNQRRAINSEIKQYQEQKREADSYQRKAEERDQALVTHVLWKLYHFQRVMDESGAEIEKHQEELKEFRRGVEKYEQRLEDARKEQSKRKEKDIEEKENSLVPIDEKIAISNSNLKKYESRIAEISKERDSQARNVDQLKKDLSAWQQATQQSGRQLSDSDLQDYNKLRTQVTKRTAADQTRIDTLTRQLKTDEETANNLKSKLDAEIQDLRERRDSYNSQFKQTQKDIDAKKKEHNNLTSEKRQKHLEVLRKLQEADDGRRESEKEIRAKETVAAMKRIFPGPKQKKYETAVSTVLGRHFDSVVVDTEKVAKECIQYLRDQRVGQLTFVPLDTIQVKAVNPNLKGMHRGMRLAIDTIEYDNVVERAMSYACGNAMVCDDLSVAKYLVFQKNVEAKAVTLDGGVIHKAGLMTGGRGPNDRNARRWEDAEVENLRRMRDKYWADLNALPKASHASAEEDTLLAELSGLEHKLRYYQEEVKALDRNIESKKKEHAFVKNQLDEASPKYHDQAQSVQALKDALKGHQDTVSEVEDEVFADFCNRLGYDSIRSYEVQQGSLQQEAAQKKLEFTTQRTRLENQLSFETQRLESTKERIKALENQAKRDEDLIESLETEKDSIQSELDVLNDELEQLEKEVEKLKEQNTEKAENVAQQRRELQKRSKNVEATLKTITSLEAEAQRNAAGRYNLLRKCKIDEIKIPLTEESEKLESLPLDDMLAGGEADPDAMDVDGDDDNAGVGTAEVKDYGIEVDFDELDDDLKEDGSEAQESNLLEIINTIASELEKMAPNMRAVERLEGTENRLKTTERDFESARRSAKRAKDDFEEVKEKRLELFDKAFNHIADQIGQVYKELTRSLAFPMGGSAYLDKEDDDEPYLSGLKYHAMPPLKRFRDMEHLSGGEKTMAALALLFAVHSYQPSPFFVLDEVDAALDNANVAKIANYIRDHAGPGMQFIVISLKTGLFQCSQTLVGVMRDQVVNSSRTLTLDLRNYQEVAVR
ncbi:putative cohesin complex subunit [Rhizodiscina lignyota]|uniref:Structural maintenance of chromosomes protein n=1 Tax=Rhizodiscina lignyota TaxID=1504668 RepID=A0A9P4M3B4_9PEZI|nr:putative cohesin complex subunit [Rhizodiscina lignyota]